MQSNPYLLSVWLTLSLACGKMAKTDGGIVDNGNHPDTGAGSDNEDAGNVSPDQAPLMSAKSVKLFAKTFALKMPLGFAAKSQTETTEHFEDDDTESTLTFTRVATLCDAPLERSNEFGTKVYRCDDGTIHLLSKNKLAIQLSFVMPDDELDLILDTFKSL